jgi:flagellar biosynthesis regulator FlaF
MKPDNHQSILTEAQGLVHGARNDSYGHPLDDYTRTAEFWTTALKDLLKEDAKIDAERAILMMILMKVSRQINLPKRDNMTDVAGYAECEQWTIDERQRRSEPEPGITVEERIKQLEHELRVLKGK